MRTSDTHSILLAAALLVVLLPGMAIAQSPFAAAPGHASTQPASGAFLSPEGPHPPPYESDILSARPIRYWIGLGPGALYFEHQGTYSPNCDCAFGGEDGVRFTFAGEFRVEYPKLGFAWSVLFGHADASAPFTVEETRESVVVGDEPDIDVLYRRESEVKLQWLRFNPGVFWYFPRSAFFLRGGLEIGVPLEYRYDHRESILTAGVEYYDGTTERVLLEEQDIPGGDRLRIALTGDVGYDFLITPSIAVSPRFGLAAPLGNVSSTDGEWKVLTAHGFLMLNLRL